MTRAAIYARVSSAAQRDAHTIENQLRVLPAFVAAQGWSLVDTYIDDGRSAKTGKAEKREGLARMLADVERRAFDVLVVVDVDRLTRTSDAIERAGILGPFQRAGIGIVTPSGGRLDLDSFIGGLYVELQARFAAEENRKRAERVKAGKARAIAEGRKPAGPTPYGLAYSRAAGAWSIDETRAAVVREIFDRVIAGESCQVIAEDLYDRGAVPPRGPWHRHKVWQIARSRTYVGEWTADKATRAIVRVPALITEPTWQRAQEKLIEHGKRGLVKTKHVYLLEGLGTCGVCGSPIAIRSATTTRGYRHPAAYVCRARKLDQRGPRCPSPILRVADVDAVVWAAAARVLVSPELLAAIDRRHAARAANHRDWQADVRRYEARLGAIEKASAGIAARFRRGLLSDAAFDLELAAAARERAAIVVQLDRAREAASAHAVPQERAEDWPSQLRTLAAAGSPEARQRVVRFLVPRGEAILVDGRVELTIDLEEPTPSAIRLASVIPAGYRMYSGDEHRRVLRFRVLTQAAS